MGNESFERMENLEKKEKKTFDIEVVQISWGMGEPNAKDVQKLKEMGKDGWQVAGPLKEGWVIMQREI